MLYAVARALRLGEAESTHLFDLVRAATNRGDRTRAPRRSGPAVPDGVQDLLDSMVTAPAVVLSGHLDVVAANALGRALHAPLFARTRGRRTWPASSSSAPPRTGSSRSGTSPPTMPSPCCRARRRAPRTRRRSPGSSASSPRSEDFRRRWAAHNVKAHRHGVKRFRHAGVGELVLIYNMFDIGPGGLSLFGYTAEPHSRSADALRLLASWVVTAE